MLGILKSVGNAIYPKKQLLYTDLPVSHIAYDSGFNNLAGFNLQF